MPRLSDEQLARRREAMDASQRWRHTIAAFQQRVHVREIERGLRPQILDLIAAEECYDAHMNRWAKEAKHQAALRAPASPLCGVYFLVHEEAIKIGSSIDVIARRGGYRAVHGVRPEPIAFLHCQTLADARATEFDLHKRFGSIRLSDAEWFKDDGQIRAYIAEQGLSWPPVLPELI